MRCRPTSRHNKAIYLIWLSINISHSQESARSCLFVCWSCILAFSCSLISSWSAIVSLNTHWFFKARVIFRICNFYYIFLKLSKHDTFITSIERPRRESSCSIDQSSFFWLSLKNLKIVSSMQRVHLNLNKHTHGGKEPSVNEHQVCPHEAQTL